jgi:hypothetical protein
MDDGGDYVTTHARAAIPNDFPDVGEPGVIYRGMSADEYKDFLATGKLKSKGEYNIGDSQGGLTYYSTNPRSARAYAHGFTPTQFQATVDKPAYVVAIRSDGLPIREVPGTAEHEVGVVGEVGKDRVVSVYRGDPYSVSHGNTEFIEDFLGVRQGNGNSPEASLIWKKIE